MARELCTAAVPSLEDSQTTLVIASLTVILTFMFISVILRLVSRYLSVATFGPDDYLIVVAMNTQNVRGEFGPVLNMAALWLYFSQSIGD
ncbi:MAG: hypothetical protein Q9191_000926 [Dirinaria sp. TL-2023a]